MSGIYKIEAQSEDNAGMIQAFISDKGGKSVVKGSAIITDYPFNSNHALWLLPLISSTSDQISQTDYDCWAALG